MSENSATAQPEVPQSKFRVPVRWDFVGLWLVLGVLTSLVGTPLACLIWEQFLDVTFIGDPDSLRNVMMMIPFGWVAATFLPPGWLYFGGLFLSIANKNQRPLWISFAGAVMFATLMPFFLVALSSI